MAAGFVHLSDIHFGQAKGGRLWIHNDVKEQLISDVAALAPELKSGRAAGILVTGDVAFSGKVSQYKEAAAWLDRVAEAAGCAITDIQVVPGNHDMDRDEITAATEMMLREIATEGESALDEFLKSDFDRQLLFRRFSAFLPFAEAYRCPLDTNAELAEERVLELAPGRFIRFVRLNSALICSNNDEEGKLLLGARQRVLRVRPGEELVVLSHHPLNWFQDSDDARLYVRRRARVFMSGHEHYPSISTEAVEDGTDLMMLAAGATVPPTTDENYTYCYNFVEFEWDEHRDALSVTVRPRAWVNDNKRFESDEERLGTKTVLHTLGCPNFRAASPTGEAREFNMIPVAEAASTIAIVPPVAKTSSEERAQVPDNYALLLLRFFRDISEVDRLRILVEFGALPSDWNGVLSETVERRAFDSLVKAGKSDELWEALNSRLDK